MHFKKSLKKLDFGVMFLQIQTNVPRFLKKSLLKSCFFESAVRKVANINAKGFMVLFFLLLSFLWPFVSLLHHYEPSRGHKTPDWVLFHGALKFSSTTFSKIRVGIHSPILKDCVC